jgi:signal peptidase I
MGFFSLKVLCLPAPFLPPSYQGKRGGGKKGDKLVVNPVVTFGQNYTPESFYKKLFFIRSAMEREKKNKILC